MSTLGALRTEITDDIARIDLSAQISSAITAAVVHYQEKRFYFNETETATFVTVAAQSSYSSSDDADIPNFIELDDISLSDGSNAFDLRPASPAEMKRLLALSSSGRPYRYSYFQSKFHLYPVPDAVYTLTPIGHIIIAAPASDAEADNPWMTEAYELIRCRAKAYLCAHVTMDLEMASTMITAEADAYAMLRRKTAKKQLATTDAVESTDF